MNPFSEIQGLLDAQRALDKLIAKSRSPSKRAFLKCQRAHIAQERLIWMLANGYTPSYYWSSDPLKMVMFPHDVTIGKS